MRSATPLLLLILVCSSALSDPYATERQAMLRLIEADVDATSDYLNKRALDERVMQAMLDVHRHRFVPRDLRNRAYENRPLPIGYGQTISQPYIVAIMTDLLQLEADDRVLEVGTGSGYQAAVLSELVANVYTIEIIEGLAVSAAERLKELGYDNVEVRHGDGYYGWEEHAKFDAVIVTAGATHIPPPLIEQLEPGGRLIIPVGSRFLTQQLMLLEKSADGGITTRQILPVRFVPLTGGHD